MKNPVPPHYTAFRIALLVAMLAAMVGLGLLIADPRVLTVVLQFLGLDR